jgi:hypothetical protein
MKWRSLLRVTCIGQNKVPASSVCLARQIKDQTQKQSCEQTTKTLSGLDSGLDWPHVTLWQISDSAIIVDLQWSWAIELTSRTVDLEIQQGPRCYSSVGQVPIQIGVTGNGGTSISNHDVKACLRVTRVGNSETNSIQVRCLLCSMS